MRRVLSIVGASALITCSAGAESQSIDNATKNQMTAAFLAADDAYKRGDYKSALTELNKVSKLNPGATLPSAQDLRVRALIQQKRWSEAKRFYNHLISLDLSSSPDILRRTNGYKSQIDKELAAAAERKLKAEVERKRRLAKEAADRKRKQEYEAKLSAFRRDIAAGGKYDQMCIDGPSCVRAGQSIVGPAAKLNRKFDPEFRMKAINLLAKACFQHDFFNGCRELNYVGYWYTNAIPWNIRYRSYKKECLTSTIGYRIYACGAYGSMAFNRTNYAYTFPRDTDRQKAFALMHKSCFSGKGPSDGGPLVFCYELMNMHRVKKLKWKPKFTYYVSKKKRDLYAQRICVLLNQASKPDPGCYGRYLKNRRLRLDVRKVPFSPGGIS